MNLSQMKFEVDTHTHTVLSGHAWSTLQELAASAHERGMAAFCVTEHGPGIEGGAPSFLPHAFKALPDEICGVHVYKGMEFNIIGPDGLLDANRKYDKCLDFGIASLHSAVWTADDIRVHTDTALAALENPFVDVIGHPGNPAYSIGAEALVLHTKKLGKLIEINNHSFAARTGSYEGCVTIAKLCKKHDVRVTVSSDAHYSGMIGCFEKAIAMLESVDFPYELIVSRTHDSFKEYLAQRLERLAPYI